MFPGAGKLGRDESIREMRDERYVCRKGNKGGIKKKKEGEDRYLFLNTNRIARSKSFLVVGH